MTESLLVKLVSEDYELSGSGRWLKVRDDESASSLVIDLERNVFWWNSRGLVGDEYIWLREVKKLSHEDAKKRIADLTKYSSNYVVVNDKHEEVVIHPKLLDTFWENGKTEREYWYKRGISDKTIDRLGLGYIHEWYTIPFLRSGELVNFQMRRDLPEKRLKNWYSGIGPILYNPDVLKLTSSVIICEGPTDCIKLLQEGLPQAISHNGGAGCWLEKWNKLFYDQKEIFVCYDNDAAGVEGAKKVAQNLGEYKTKIFTFADTGIKGYDIVDFYRDGGTTAQLSELLRTKSKRVFEL